MTYGFYLPRVLALVAVAAWLAGCASSPTSRFYTLTPLAPAAEKPIPPEATHPVAVSVGPITIPDYLDRPQIVTRGSRNELKLSEFDRWGGSLADNIASVVAENLAHFLGTDRVFVLPRMSAEKTDYSVALRVQQLDCVPGEHVILKAQWTVSDGPEAKGSETRIMTITERLSDKDYDTMVAAVSRAMEAISREIASEISSRSKGAAKPPAL